jgi:hypothetical protein
MVACKKYSTRQEEKIKINSHFPDKVTSKGHFITFCIPVLRLLTSITEDLRLPRAVKNSIGLIPITCNSIEWSSHPHVDGICRAIGQTIGDG